MATKKTAPVQNDNDLLVEVRKSLDEAERLMKDASEATGAKATEMREAAMESLRHTRATIHDTQEALVDKGRDAAKATDHYVHEKPWQAIALAGTVGVLFGILVGRK